VSRAGPGRAVIRCCPVALARVEAQVAELGLRVLSASDDVAADDGARDVAGWIDHHNRVDRPTARREQRLAEALDRRWRRVQTGMRDGVVSAEQAHVITRALDKLPEHVSTEVKGLAEERLVEEARSFGPAELRVMGRRVLDVVAPELGEEAESKALEAEEAAAAARTYLVGRRCGDGRTAVRGDVPDAAWDRLVTYLEAYTSPQQPGQERDHRGRHRRPRDPR
jgi:hypothetical protein